jgi:hypothetical protein
MGAWMPSHHGVFKSFVLQMHFKTQELYLKYEKRGSLSAGKGGWDILVTSREGLRLLPLLAIFSLME